MRLFLVPCLSTVTLFLLLAFGAVGEPVQYCRFGHRNQDDTVDFCLGITTHYNASSGEHDMYMSMEVTRSSALGWTAIGTGSRMAGSLMFIIYGDPFSSEHESPTVSIRTIDGHHQPRLLSQGDMGGADLRLLQADWVLVGATGVEKSQRHWGSIAKAAVVCYSCGQWTGTPISADATAQPWIWAWNDHQEFDAYSNDVHLKVHGYHPGSGGWGRFYVDMARSTSKYTSPPSLPPIRHGVSALGASDIPGGWSWMGPIGHIHGLLMSTAFLVLFPVGVFAMRSGSQRALQYHWILQLLASVFVLIGMALGLIRAHSLDSFHHWIGIIVAGCSLIQIVLGWRHHVLFVRIQLRQWASHGHIWLGRAVLLLGWTNVITGLLLSGYGWLWLAVAICSILVDALGLVGWVWYAARRLKQREIRPDWEEDSSLYTLQPTRDDYFAVAAEEDESEFRSSGDNSETVIIHKKNTE
ncbi:hypothetical protein BDW59DRAFT_17481 [Aspergillus cavernicola]|uniref:Cytochrome b561 domain-containing protein n=1 Tax=Aspergillus cavernicola TaxID=176166 RepID=A0ABR4HID1_9EURO